jgi:exonuclease III
MPLLALRLLLPIGVWPPITQVPPVYVATSVIPSRRFGDEGRSILTVFPKLAILNVYIPQGNRDGRNLDYKLDSLSQLADFAKQWTDPPLLLCGDFNIARTEADLARPAANTATSMRCENSILTREVYIVGGLMLIRPDQGTLAGAWTTSLYRLGFEAS